MTPNTYAAQSFIPEDGRGRIEVNQLVVFVSTAISLFGKRRRETQARERTMTKRLGDSFPAPCPLPVPTPCPFPGEEMLESLLNLVFPGSPGSGCWSKFPEDSIIELVIVKSVSFGSNFDPFVPKSVAVTSRCPDVNGWWPEEEKILDAILPLRPWDSRLERREEVTSLDCWYIQIRNSSDLLWFRGEMSLILMTL